MSDDIDRRILDFLAKQDWPVTTENVAAGGEVTWNTAEVHLLRLVAGGFVRGKKVGRQNQWILTEDGRKKAKKASAERG